MVRCSRFSLLLLNFGGGCDRPPPPEGFFDPCSEEEPCPEALFCLIWVEGPQCFLPCETDGDCVFEGYPRKDYECAEVWPTSVCMERPKRA